MQLYNEYLTNTTSNFITLFSDVIFENRGEISKMNSSDEVVEFFKSEFNLPEQTKKHPSNKGLMNDAPTAKKRAPKSTANEPQYLELDKYLEHYKNQNPTPICSYMASSGQYVDKICSRVLTDDEFKKYENDTDDFSYRNYRCGKCCSSKGEPKKGKLLKMLENNSKIGGNNKNIVSNGFNKADKPKPVVVPDDDEEDDPFPIKMVSLSNVDDYYKFGDDSKYPGLVFTENDDNDITCIGKLLDDNGESIHFKKNTKLDEDWKDNLSNNFTKKEIKLFKEENVIFKSSKEEKKKIVPLQDDSESENEN